MAKVKAPVKRLRLISYKTWLTPRHTETIIRAATAVLLMTTTVTDFKTQPSNTDMRKLLKPAYDILAAWLSLRTNQTIKSEQLCNLHLEMHPILGTYKIFFGMDTGEMLPQFYRLDVAAEDGLNMFLRNPNHGADVMLKNSKEV